MDFGEALKALRLGKQVYRKAWASTKLRLGKSSSNIKEYGDAEDCIFAILWTGHAVVWREQMEDILATDWVVDE